MDTIKARKARSENFSERQQSIVVGSLLGDGYLAKTTRGYAFRVNHGIAQSDYVDWKYRELETFTNSAPQRSNRCYYFRTISHSYFDRLHAIFYKNGKKQLPRNIDELINPLTLSVWIMDDGAKDGRQLRINSQSFSYVENEEIIRVLKAKLGISATLNRDKDRFRLRVRANSMSIVRNIVAPHIISSMQYKLSP